MAIGLRDVSMFGAKSYFPSPRSADLPGNRTFGGIEIVIGEWDKDIGVNLERFIPVVFGSPITCTSFGNDSA